MRILFVMPQSKFLRYLHGVVHALADRGHQVCVATEDGTKRRPPSPPLGERVTYAKAPSGRTDAWSRHAPLLRAVRTYLDAQREEYADAVRHRRRAAVRCVERFAMYGSRTGTSPRVATSEASEPDPPFLRDLGPVARHNVADLLQLLETSIPSAREYDDFLEAVRPDVALVTPLLGFSSAQTDLVKSARARGVPVGLPVYSWDNLTTRGMLHVMPDCLFLWNDIQADEAKRLHGVPDDRIVVTGAPRFDDFFLLRPSTSREAFCAALGLEPRRPILLYVGSSRWVIDHEQAYVKHWIEEVRRDPELKTASVIIRPHPSDTGDWKFLDRHAEGVVVTPSSSSTADQGLYDSLFHSAAVVGLNTSAALEAAIVGRPVLTILASDVAEGQHGSLHFWLLTEARGGFVQVSDSLDVHRRQLVRAVQGGADRPETRRFVERFLRPHGIELPAAPRMAEAIELFATAFARLSPGGSRDDSTDVDRNIQERTRWAAHFSR